MDLRTDDSYDMSRLRYRDAMREEPFEIRVAEETEEGLPEHLWKPLYKYLRDKYHRDEIHLVFDIPLTEIKSHASKFPIELSSYLLRSDPNLYGVSRKLSHSVNRYIGGSLQKNECSRPLSGHELGMVLNANSVIYERIKHGYIYRINFDDVSRHDRSQDDRSSRNFTSDIIVVFVDKNSNSIVQIVDDKNVAYDTDQYEQDAELDIFTKYRADLNRKMCVDMSKKNVRGKEIESYASNRLIDNYNYLMSEVEANIEVLIGNIIFTDLIISKFENRWKYNSLDMDGLKRAYEKNMKIIANGVRGMTGAKSYRDGDKILLTRVGTS